MNEREVLNYFLENPGSAEFKNESMPGDPEKGDLPVEVTITSLKQNGAEVQDRVCIANDLAAKRRLEIERSEKEKIKGIVQAMATVNHEINNPLTPILGNLSLLIADSTHLTPEEVSKLKGIQDSAELIREKVYKLSNISKPIFKTYYKDELIIDIDRSQ